MPRKPLPPPNEGTPRDATNRDRRAPAKSGRDADKKANPPHTTTGKITSPKFGSAGSGGAEFEPGPKRP